MKGLFLILVIATTAYCSVEEDIQLRANREKWDFAFKVPNTPFATGLLHKANEKENLNYVSFKTDTVLPDHFDLTPGLTPIKNQGQCGSCWAFATVGAVENFPHPDNASGSPLSEQQMMDCDQTSLGCSGGYVTALNYAANPGLALYSNYAYPYLAYNTYCYAAKTEAKVVEWAYLGSANQEPTVDDIKQALYESHAPVVATITADMTFMSYRSGIFTGCSQDATNHMIDIVGWDNTDEVWIGRNSWGTEWGEKGYFKIKWNDPWGRKCNRIGEQAAYIKGVTFSKVPVSHRAQKVGLTRPIAFRPGRRLTPPASR